LPSASSNQEYRLNIPASVRGFASALRRRHRHLPIFYLLINYLALRCWHESRLEPQ
jgi:hypothetical protein